MWPVSPLRKAWHHAMHRQDLHETVCLPCRVNRTPVCPEGLRLQALARRAHDAWAADEYVGKAVA